jgi:hypothetical protein
MDRYATSLNKKIMNEGLDQLAFKFFKLFAQYESALKEQGYFKKGGRDVVSANWDLFANQKIGSNFLQDLGANADAANYILQYPPKKQIVNNQEKIVWDDVKNTDKSVQALFGHICRTRNNLFHGAKFNGSWFDPERSEALLSKSLNILEYYRSRLGL